MLSLVAKVNITRITIRRKKSVHIQAINLKSAKVYQCAKRENTILSDNGLVGLSSLQGTSGLSGSVTGTNPPSSDDDNDDQRRLTMCD